MSSSTGFGAADTPDFRQFLQDNPCKQRLSLERQNKIFQAILQPDTLPTGPTLTRREQNYWSHIRFEAEGYSWLVKDGIGKLYRAPEKGFPSRLVVLNDQVLEAIIATHNAGN